jgi:hypothetical protein
MNGLLIVATAAFLLLMPQFNDADAAGPYDSEWTGTATSIDERCKRAVFTLIVEGQVVLGHARFEGDAPNVNGTVDENGALGATIGFQPFRGRSEPPGSRRCSGGSEGGGARSRKGVRTGAVGRQIR